MVLPITTRRPLLALALASALTGCVSAPPAGPVAEYRTGSPAATAKVACDANYAIVARDENGPRGPLGERHVRKGECVGFRPESDGSVTAIAPGYTLSLPSGSYAWEAVPGSLPTEREQRMCETRSHALRAAKVVGIVLVGIGLVLAIGLLYGTSHFSLSGSGPLVFP